MLHKISSTLLALLAAFSFGLAGCGGDTAELEQADTMTNEEEQQVEEYHDQYEADQARMRQEYGN